MKPSQKLAQRETLASATSQLMERAPSYRPEPTSALKDGDVANSTESPSVSSLSVLGWQPALPSALRALGHRNFRLFWTGQLISLIGTWMQMVARGWLVLELTHSPFWQGEWCVRVSLYWSGSSGQFTGRGHRRPLWRSDGAVYRRSCMRCRHCRHSGSQTGPASTNIG